MSRRFLAAAAVILSCACVRPNARQLTLVPCSINDVAVASPHVSPAPCGAHEVDMVSLTLVDRSRNRIIPATVYLPRDSSARYPLVLFSHGLGNSNLGYRYLGAYWATHGYVSIHLDHAGSDSSFLVRHGPFRLLRAFFDRREWSNRSGDMTGTLALIRGGDSTVSPRGGADAAAIDAVRQLADFDRIAFAGHSYGSFAALDALRQLANAHAKPAHVVAIMLSPPEVMSIVREDIYKTVDAPVLHMFGGEERTRFTKIVLGKHPLDFDQTAAKNQFLVVINGAEHSTFSDDLEAPPPEHEQQIAMIQIASTRFLDAWLRDSSDDRTWLVNGIADWARGRAVVRSK